MWRRRMLAAALMGSALVTMGPSGLVTVAQEPARPIREFMRAKLQYSQGVLEGLTLEDYERINKNAKALGILSEAADWQVLPDPDYVRLSAEFRKLTNRLSAAADRKNLDGATLAYVELTLNCVNCHKIVRSRATASLLPVGPATAEVAAAGR